MRETEIVVIKLEAGLNSATQTPIVVNDKNLIATRSFGGAGLF
jgi:hypothetical protein